MIKRFKEIKQVNAVNYTEGKEDSFCECGRNLTIAEVLLPAKIGTTKETFLDCLDCNKDYYNMLEFFLRQFINK